VVHPCRPCIRALRNHTHPNPARRNLHKFHHSHRNLLLHPRRSRITTSHNNHHTNADSNPTRRHFHKLLHNARFQPLQRLHIHRDSSRPNTHNHGSWQLSYGDAERDQDTSRRNIDRFRRQHNSNPIRHPNSTRRNNHKHSLPARREQHFHVHQHRNNNLLRNGNGNNLKLQRFADWPTFSTKSDDCLCHGLCHADCADDLYLHLRARDDLQRRHGNHYGFV
jgi:hypothetical protein